MNIRVLIVAEHASASLGGEAALPLHYYRILRSRNIPTWLLLHERTRAELERLFPNDENITYIADTLWHRLLWKVSQWLPSRLAYFTTGIVMRLLTQLAQRRIARRLIQAHHIDIVHQPIPVSPKEPSAIFDMGVPVVIGPMNGGMDFPVAFQQMQNSAVDLTMLLGRKVAHIVNAMVPGKQRAAVLLVANERSRRALPKGSRAQVLELVENGVDLSLWQPAQAKAMHRGKEHSLKPSAITRYVFVGRLVDWKAVDFLLVAFKKAARNAKISLTIVGDGEERDRLRQQAQRLGILDRSNHIDQQIDRQIDRHIDRQIDRQKRCRQPPLSGKIAFTGWLSQADCSTQLEQCDALVLPSMLECGGAVVLEAMAKGLPVIATNWGGPADYLDETCGILVSPESQVGFVEKLAEAMVALALLPEKRQAMGRAGQAKVRKQFDWEVKVDRMMEIYMGAIANRKIVSKAETIRPHYNLRKHNLRKHNLSKQEQEASER